MAKATDNKANDEPYNTPFPVSWSRAWQTDPLGGDLSDQWPLLIDCFRSRAPLGEPAPDFTGGLLDGHPFTLSSRRGKKSVLIVFGSLACPPCVTNIDIASPSLNSLYDEYKDAIEFVYVYTREAHPGSKIGAHQSIEEKHANAATLKNLEHMKFPLLVDDLDGSIHLQYADPQFNNPVFLVNRAGRIAYKSAWLDASELPQVLADQKLWDERSQVDKTVKKTFSERIRLLREPFDPDCNRRIKTLMNAIGLEQQAMGPIPGIEANLSLQKTKGEL